MLRSIRAYPQLQMILELPSMSCKVIPGSTRHVLQAIAQGVWEVQLVTDPKGENGFGYDPMFYVPSRKCTSAELPPEIKNQLSHRGQALKQLLGKLSEIYSME